MSRCQKVFSNSLESSKSFCFSAIHTVGRCAICYERKDCFDVSKCNTGKFHFTKVFKICSILWILIALKLFFFLNSEPDGWWNKFQIHTKSEKHFFASFASRDQTFITLRQLWKVSSFKSLVSINTKRLSKNNILKQGLLIINGQVKSNIMVDIQWQNFSFCNTKYPNLGWNYTWTSLGLGAFILWWWAGAYIRRWGWLRIVQWPNPIIVNFDGNSYFLLDSTMWEWMNYLWIDCLT